MHLPPARWIFRVDENDSKYWDEWHNTYFHSLKYQPYAKVGVLSPLLFESPLATYEWFLCLVPASQASGSSFFSSLSAI